MNSKIRVEVRDRAVVIAGAVPAPEIRSRAAAFRALFGAEPTIQIRGSWTQDAIHFGLGAAPRPAAVSFPEPTPVLSVGRIFVVVGDCAPVAVVPERGLDVEVQLSCG